MFSNKPNITALNLGWLNTYITAFNVEENFARTAAIVSANAGGGVYFFKLTYYLLVEPIVH